METLNDVIEKRMSKSLLCLLQLIDPQRQYGFDKDLIESWNRLTLTDQRRLYLYLLYRKWRGEGFYGTPYEIVRNCHPYPTNWNGKQMLNRLMKENQMVSAFYNGSYGIYTRDEAKVWHMTRIEPQNYKRPQDPL